MRFYLGTHRPSWLAKVDYPLFVSNRVLHDRKTFPRAQGQWALDSGGFSELNLYGQWVTTPSQYVALTKRYASEVGNMDWAAVQDWMCEPFVLKRTGLTVHIHQIRTITSYLQLRSLAPNLPWVPVLQGWRLDDYLHHIEMYAKVGIDLTTLPLVGVGSVCRRQNTDEAGEILSTIASMGISIHGFGVKKQGIKKYADSLTSADSMAWSYRARRTDPLPGHEAQHKNCANCLDFATHWRSELIELIPNGH